MGEPRIAYEWSILEHVMGAIQAADNKASAALVIDSLIAGFLFSTVSGLLDASGDVTPAASLNEFVAGVLVAGSAALFGSLICALGCLTGRAGLLPNGRIGRPKNTLIFFGRIAEYDRAAYIEAVRGATSVQLESDLAGQTHVLAQIAQDKYRWLNAGYGLLLAAMLLFVFLAAVVFFF